MMNSLPIVVMGCAAGVAAILHRVERKLMDINVDLAEVKQNLVEASAEIVGKIGDLEAQLAAAGADPELVAEVKTLAKGLADIVPNPDPEPEPEPQSESDPEQPAATESE